MEQTRKNQWVTLLIAIFSFAVYNTAFQAIPPLIPAITQEFSITAVEAGLVMSVVIVPGLLLSLPSGWLLNKYQPKKVGIAALVFITVSSLVTASSTSFELLLFGRLLLGFGGILITITSLAIISQWFGNKDLGKATGLWAASVPITVVIIFPVMSLIITSVGWRFPFYLSSLAGLAAIALFFFFIKNGPYSKDKEIKSGHPEYFNPSIWKLGIVCLCAQGAGIAFSTWAPTLFAEFANMPSVQASFLAGLSSFLTIFFVPFFGYMSDRIEKRRFFLILGPLLMTLTFITLAIGSDIIMIASLLLMGVANAMVVVVTNVLPPEILGHSKASIGFGVISICGSLGSILAIPIIGLLIDMTGSFAVSLFGMGAFSIVAAIFAFTLKTK